MLGVASRTSGEDSARASQKEAHVAGEGRASRVTWCRRVVGH